MVLLSYQLHLMFLSAPYPYVQIMVLGKMGEFLYVLFISNTSFFSWGDVRPEDGLRQNEWSDSEICDW